MPLSLFLSGCGIGTEMNYDEFNSMSEKDMWLDAGTRAVPALFDEAYVIGPKDVVSLLVTDHEEFNGNLPVDLKGEIRLPLLSEPLLVDGLTLEQAKASVAQALSPFVRGSVECQVDLVSTGSRFYYVMGSGVDTVKALGAGSSSENTSSSTSVAHNPGSITKVPMGVEPVMLRDLLLENQHETDLEEITIIRPDFTDRRSPTFMTIDMSDIPRAIWNQNYRVKPNDIIVVHKNLRERVKDIMTLYITEVESANAKETEFNQMIRFLEARVYDNNTEKKAKWSNGR